MISAPPKFDENSVRLSVRKGEEASLICESTGDNPLDILWRRNGLPIQEEDDARYEDDITITRYGH